ncbi:Pycsar system effector family protein [Tsukamurella pulmonis]|uniref:Pycsar system effector family protein n=1 Tax=Tsukamurella pulmonis TaxID=47312 RepID=UPI000B09520C|nr:Pycsar system effector family protein [Tsukamurella pulmonis]
MTSPDPVDTAWKIHAALADWTGKVDTKATFALTIESALIAGVVTLSADGRPLNGLTGWAAMWYWCGTLLLAAGAVTAGSVVRPRLRKAELQAESEGNFIYFGHLQHLTPDQIAEHLKETALLPVLSKQLSEMSKIAWKKHRQVQLSLSFAPVGVACLFIASTYG